MTRLVLASESESRRAILKSAGVPFVSLRPATDEAAMKIRLLNDRADAATVAMTLAVAKAHSVAAAAGQIVLGADQVLVCDGRIFDKAGTVEEARAVLKALRGRRHDLITAAALVQNGELIWQHGETASLWMREFSDDFLDGYLQRAHVDILSAVGCYHVEGLGAQLFSRIEGDHFAIRGLGLTPLLAALRRLEVLPS
jgi:septum formation protein